MCALQAHSCPLSQSIPMQRCRAGRRACGEKACPGKTIEHTFPRRSKPECWHSILCCVCYMAEYSTYMRRMRRYALPGIVYRSSCSRCYSATTENNRRIPRLHAVASYYSSNRTPYYDGITTVWYYCCVRLLVPCLRHTQSICYSSSIPPATRTETQRQTSARETFRKEVYTAAGGRACLFSANRSHFEGGLKLAQLRFCFTFRHALRADYTTVSSGDIYLYCPGTAVVVVLLFYHFIP